MPPSLTSFDDIWDMRLKRLDGRFEDQYVIFTKGVEFVEYDEFRTVHSSTYGGSVIAVPGTLATSYTLQHDGIVVLSWDIFLGKLEHTCEILTEGNHTFGITPDTIFDALEFALSGE